MVDRTDPVLALNAGPGTRRDEIELIDQEDQGAFRGLEKRLVMAR